MNKYKGIEVIMTNEIMKEHNLTKNNVRSLFVKNKKNLILDVDYFKLTHDETMKLPFRGTGGYPKGVILYTMSGYKKLMGKKAVLSESNVRPQMIAPKPQVENPFLDVLSADREAYVGIIRKQSEQIDALIKLLSKTIKTPMELPEFKERVKAADWYAEINSLVENIHAKTKQDKNVILSNAYKILDAQYGLCLDQYRRDYGEIIHKKPTVLDTIYWVETEQNPNTKGLLSGVLENMLVN